jgi:glycerol-3-phosphate dehydrogenase
LKRARIQDLSGQTFDFIIIGGGITGVSIARDAAMRGFSVVLLEKEDFAAGTSSRSTKLLHGGLRYLQQHEFKLVREACRERELFLYLAPHLAHIRPFIYVLYRGYPESPLLLNLGLTIYDIFSGNPIKRRHRMLNAKKLLEIEPHLNSAGLLAGGLYYDSLTDDARLTVETAKSAFDSGATIANYAEVVGFISEAGKIQGVEVLDRLSGASGSIRAKCVVNATGVWTDRVRALEKGIADRRLRPTKGVHIVLRKQDYPLQHAVFLRSPRDQRVAWPIPALDGDLVYVGTTDTFYEGPLEDVTASSSDIDYLLELARQAIPDAKLDYDSLVGTWAGLRPLVAADSSKSASSVSREHEIFVSPEGLLNIAGGKLTTARVMAQQLVDKAIALHGPEFRTRHPRAIATHKVPLSGGDLESISNAKRAVASIPVSAAIGNRWMSHYGGNAKYLAEICATDPSAAQEMGDGRITPAEIRYVVEEEMAMTVSDFFIRRSTIFFWTQDGGLAIADQVAAEMARQLGWSSEERAQQVRRYREQVTANRLVPTASHV